MGSFPNSFIDPFKIQTRQVSGCVFLMQFHLNSCARFFVFLSSNAFFSPNTEAMTCIVNLIIR